MINDETRKKFSVSFVNGSTNDLKMTATPVIAEDMIFGLGADMRLTAANAHTGKKIWTIKKPDKNIPAKKPDKNTPDKKHPGKKHPGQKNPEPTPLTNTINKHHQPTNSTNSINQHHQQTPSTNTINHNTINQNTIHHNTINHSFEHWLHHCHKHWHKHCHVNTINIG